MFSIFIMIQVFLALSIIGLVLLQQGKGADMGAAFGAGASGSVFGSRGSGSFLTRATAVFAFLFFANSILLSSPILHDKDGTDSSVTSVLTEPVQSDPLESATEDTESAMDFPPGDFTKLLDKPSGESSDLPAIPADTAGAGDLPK